MIYVFLADGFEETEAKIYKQIDICLPAGSSCQPLHSPQRSILCNI